MGKIVKCHKPMYTITIEARKDPKTGKRRRIVRSFAGTKREAEKELIRLLATGR
ncbi:MAG: hypothetical protein HPY71_14340 [Firmicutes bacterium]|nr:hypothetical protein [Bacillota bacterium]